MKITFLFLIIVPFISVRCKNKLEDHSIFINIDYDFFALKLTEELIRKETIEIDSLILNTQINTLPSKKVLLNKIKSVHEKIVFCQGHFKSQLQTCRRFNSGIIEISNCLPIFQFGKPNSLFPDILAREAHLNYATEVVSYKLSAYYNLLRVLLEWKGGKHFKPALISSSDNILYSDMVHIRCTDDARITLINNLYQIFTIEDRKENKINLPSFLDFSRFQIIIKPNEVAKSVDSLFADFISKLNSSEIDSLINVKCNPFEKSNFDLQVFNYKDSVYISPFKK